MAEQDLSSATVKSEPQEVKIEPVEATFASSTSVVQEPPKSTTPPNARVCGVCVQNPAKYKCTTCEIPYCSVGCNQEHKVTHLMDPPPAESKDTAMSSLPPPPTNGTSNPPPATTPGTSAHAAGRVDVLAPLLSSNELQNLFIQFPSLRSQLRAIYDACQSPRDNVYGSGQDKRFWTKEQGQRDGLEALNDAKKKFGNDGEGVRQFAELVIRLVSPENAVNGNLDGLTANQNPRPSIDEGAQNAKLILQLLNNELNA